MNGKFIYEIRLYCNPYSILVINKLGKLKRIYCPFPVKVLIDIADLKKDEVVIVQQVRISRDLRLLYIISYGAYRSSLFVII